MLRNSAQTSRAGRKARQSADFLLRNSGLDKVDVAIVLGSGWAQTAQLVGRVTYTVTSKKVPGFPRAAIPGHSGLIQVATTRRHKNVLIIGARTHLYEGRSVHNVVHAVRTAAACGAKVLVLTNGAGGTNPAWKPGQPVLISDHVNLTSTSPLVGPEFVDLSDLYAARLRAIARQVEPTLEEGVYFQFRGPNYETPAEVQMVAAMGGDLVGMSTALEAIAARAAGMEVLGLSLVTNLAAGISAQPLSHEEVLAAGKSAEPALSQLLANIVQQV